MLAMIALVSALSAQSEPLARYTVTLKTPAGQSCVYTVAIRSAGSTPRQAFERSREHILARLAERCGR